MRLKKLILIDGLGSRANVQVPDQLRNRKFLALSLACSCCSFGHNKEHTFLSYSAYFNYFLVDSNVNVNLIFSLFVKYDEPERM